MASKIATRRKITKTKKPPAPPIKDLEPPMPKVAKAKAEPKDPIGLSVRISGVIPKHREQFKILMEAYGINGVVRNEGRLGTVERALTSYAGNPCFDIPMSLQDYLPLSLAGRYRRTFSDPMYEALQAEQDAFFEDNPGSKKTRLHFDTVRRESDYFFSGEVSTQHRKSVQPTPRNIRNANFSVCVPPEALRDATVFKNWLTDLHPEIGIEPRMPTYIHGLIIEGVNTAPHKASQLPIKFVPLTNSISATEAAQERAGTSPPYPKKAAKRYAKKPPSSTAERLRLLLAKAQGVSVDAMPKGYLHIGKFILTTFASHEEWEAHQPEVTRDDTYLINKWQGKFTEDLESRKRTLEKNLEVLQRKILADERALGEVDFMLSSIKDNSSSAITLAFKKIREIPEIEKLEITTYGFRVITKNMMAYREDTSDERYCGKFEIQISIEGNVRIRNIDSPHVNYRNPHGGCTGSFNRVFAAALRKFDYHTLILALMEYYRFMDRNYLGKWELLPNSKSPPAKTFLSDWQEIAGSWQTLPANSVSPIEEALFPHGVDSIPRDQDDDAEEYDEEDDEDDDY